MELRLTAACCSSKLNVALEDKFGWTREGNFAEPVTGLFEADFQPFASTDVHTDWRLQIVEPARDQRGGHNTGATGKRFVLYSAFVGSNGQHLVRTKLYKVRVRSLGGELLVPADGRA